MTEDYRVILFDHVGSGRSDRQACRADRYGTTWDYLKEKASWALLQAKQGGGNRVAVAVAVAVE